jgi:exonuclease III
VNVHASTEDKSNDMKVNFYEELGRVFDQFLKSHMEVLIGDFNAKGRREDIFKSTIGIKSSYEISKDSGIKAEDFSASKNPVVQSSPITTFINTDWKTHNQVHHVFTVKEAAFKYSTCPIF